MTELCRQLASYWPQPPCRISSRVGRQG